MKTACHHGEPAPHWSAPRRPHDAAGLDIRGNGFDPGIAPAGTNGAAAGRRNGIGQDFRAWRSPGTKTASRSGKWLIAPHPNPSAKARLFCFPDAGGGLASFRALARSLSDQIEASGQLRLPEVVHPDQRNGGGRPRHLCPAIDAGAAGMARPAIGVFGHCLGGLTMFATLCALPPRVAHWVKHAFACGVRPPHLLRRRGVFEDNLAYGMMLHHEFDVSVPPYAQPDDVFAYIVRQFDTPAANRMLEIPKLRQVLLPTRPC